MLNWMVLTFIDHIIQKVVFKSVNFKWNFHNGSVKFWQPWLGPNINIFHIHICIIMFAYICINPVKVFACRKKKPSFLMMKMESKILNGHFVIHMTVFIFYREKKTFSIFQFMWQKSNKIDHVHWILNERSNVINK